MPETAPLARVMKSLAVTVEVMSSHAIKLEVDQSQQFVSPKKEKILSGLLDFTHVVPTAKKKCLVEFINVTDDAILLMKPRHYAGDLLSLFLIVLVEELLWIQCITSQEPSALIQFLLVRKSAVNHTLDVVILAEIPVMTLNALHVLSLLKSHANVVLKRNLCLVTSLS
jgi:hypothetical protein